MKGDFSRSTFNPRAHYSQLPLQQGRVLVDADWNEQGEIALNDRRVARRSIVGPSGGPMDRAALRLEIGLFEAGEPALAVGGVDSQPFAPSSPDYSEPGWYWVQGCTLTQEQAWPLKAQPHLTQPLPTDEGYYVAWVDSFERLLTALDRPEIREVAMGGPDHGTRMQQIWQVRLDPFAFAGGDSDGDPDCFDLPAGWQPPAPTGRLHARVADPVASQDPCVVEMTAGYRRLENQLYRVEIRDGGDETTASFVWSRDNGIVRVRAIAGSYSAPVGANPSIQVAELGRDELTRLAAGDWVEITDDARSLAALPGYLCQVARVSATTLELDLANAPSQSQFEALTAPTVRRWDTVDESKHSGAPYLGQGSYPVNAAIDADPDVYFDLEDGVQIRFAAGTFKTGDYWLVPARTTTADVEFPATAQLPHGVPHRVAALGILHCDGSGLWRVVRDCRNLFPPLTRLKQLRYVGGDGQQAIPGRLLPGALEVAVSNGTAPVEGVEVVFDVQVPNSTPDTPEERGARGYLLNTLENDLTDVLAISPNVAGGRFTQTATTDARGIASVRWVLGRSDIQSSSGWSQNVTARVDARGPGDPTGEVHFHATQSIAREVQVDIGNCEGNEGEGNAEEPALATVRQLIGLAGLDPDRPEHQNVQHVLHQLLCRLNAGHVPYVFPASAAQVQPADVSEVKGALDALYWLVLQGGGDCCLSQVIQKLAEVIGGKQGSALCEALKTGPVDGECSVLETTLGSVLNLVRVAYGIVLAFLDLQDAPGPDRGYEGLKLGDETGIELEAFVQSEGPGWFATRAEERGEQLEALSRTTDVLAVALEKFFDAHDMRDALQKLAADYGREDAESWNGPATRLYVLDQIWEPLLGTRRLDDVALVGLRELLLEIARQLWTELVELILCGEPLASRIPDSEWLEAIGGNLTRAIERAFGQHGLVRELPEERFGTAMDVHVMAPSEAYPVGATWVVASAASEEGRDRVNLLRWRHDAEGQRGPIVALDDERLPANLTLPEQDLVIGVDPVRGQSFRVLDSGARRQSLQVLAEANIGGQRVSRVLWHLPSAELSGLEGAIVERFPGGAPEFGQAFTHPHMDGGALLVSGGPDDPPSVAGFFARADANAGIFYLWPPTVREEPFVFGLRGVWPESMHVFTQATKDRPGQFVAFALTYPGSIRSQARERNVLLLLGSGDGDGDGDGDDGENVPWWEASRLSVRGSWDLPTGVRVVGGAHDVVVLQDDGGDISPESGLRTGSGLRRWTMVRATEFVQREFPTEQLAWDEAPGSVGIVEIPSERWRDGQVASVVHGCDGPWVQALGPLRGRLGLYLARSGAPPLLQRQMVRGAASGELSFRRVDRPRDGEPGDGQSVGAQERIDHDYLLQSADAPNPRLLTACLRSDPGTTPLIEFNASPRS